MMIVKRLIAGIATSACPLVEANTDGGNAVSDPGVATVPYVQSRTLVRGDMSGSRLLT